MPRHGAFDNTLPLSREPQGPRSFGRVREPGRPSTLGLATNLFGTLLGGAADIIDSAGNREISSGIDEAIEGGFEEAFGETIGEEITEGINRISKTKESSKQGRDATDRFNLFLMSEIKKLKVQHPGKEELINKLLRDRGLIDPQLQLLKEQGAIEDRAEAADFARNETMINEAVKLGVATFNEPGNPASGVDEETTLKQITEVFVARGELDRSLKSRGFFKTPSGEIKSTLRPVYIQNIPVIRRSLFIQAMAGIRAPLNQLSALMRAGDIKGVNEGMQGLTVLADQFRLDQIKNTLNLNPSEKEDYMKYVDDLLVSITSGVLGTEKITDLNQLKALENVFGYATKNAEIMNATDLPTLFRLSLLSKNLGDVLLSTNLSGNIGLKTKLARKIGLEIKTLGDIVPSKSDPEDGDIPPLGSGEVDHSKVDKQDRVQAASDIQKGLQDIGFIINSKADSYTWIQSNGPGFNAFINTSGGVVLTEEDRDVIANQMLHPNFLTNLNKSLSFHPKKAAAVGAYAFDMVQQTLQDTMRQFRNFPIFGGLNRDFKIEFDNQTKQFITKDENPLGAARRPGAGPIAGGKSFADIAGVKDRMNKINKMVPFLVETRQFKDSVKGTSEVEFMESVKDLVTKDLFTLNVTPAFIPKNAPNVQTKQGVSLEGLGTEILSAVDKAAPILEALNVPLVVTSATEGKHKKGSKHFSGNAIDIRTRQLAPENQQKVTAELKDALGTDFDVILEKDHIHIEYDPKKKIIEGGGGETELIGQVAPDRQEEDKIRLFNLLTPDLKEKLERLSIRDIPEKAAKGLEEELELSLKSMSRVDLQRMAMALITGNITGSFIPTDENIDFILKADEDDLVNLLFKNLVFTARGKEV